MGFRHGLSPLAVKKKTKRGRYADGGGLYLQVSKLKTRSWLFRFMVDGRAREMGLGSVDDFTLKEARERARSQRQLLADGIDPIEYRLKERDDRRKDEAARQTFKDAAREYIEMHAGRWHSPKHKKDWEATLAAYTKSIAERPVSAVDEPLITSCVAPIWQKIPVTAKRVRQRIKLVLEWVRAGKPLPQRSQAVLRIHHPALPYGRMGEFMSHLRREVGGVARLLEFTILTAVRSAESRGARIGEFDLKSGIWTIPAKRMGKTKRPHVVPLPDDAIAIIKAARPNKELVFPGRTGVTPFADTAMLDLIKRMSSAAVKEGRAPYVDPKQDNQLVVVHGFRSSFRDWCGEQTSFPKDVAEAALAHTKGDQVEAAYHRANYLDKRRKLMDAWARYCATPAKSADNVVPIRSAL